MDCLICLEKINTNDKYLIKHNKCSYILHRQCLQQYNKCLYCNKIIKSTLELESDINILTNFEKLVNIFIFVQIDKITDENPFIFILYLINIYIILLFIAFPIIIVNNIYLKFNYFFLFAFCFLFGSAVLFNSFDVSIV
jgi:hypothetical protein